jgi:hypothetical protein
MRRIDPVFLGSPAPSPPIYIHNWIDEVGFESSEVVSNHRPPSREIAPSDHSALDRLAISAPKFLNFFKQGDNKNRGFKQKNIIVLENISSKWFLKKQFNCSIRNCSELMWIDRSQLVDNNFSKVKFLRIHPPLREEQGKMFQSTLYSFQRPLNQFYFILTGDEILAVNGMPLQGLSHSEAISVFKNIRSGKILLHVARRDSAAANTRR